MVPREIVRNFAVIAYVHHRKVGLLAGLKRPDAFLSPEGISGVDGRCGQSFRGRHAHGGARERKNELHVERRTSSRVKVRGERHGRARINQPPGGRVRPRAEMKIGARHKRGDNVRASEGANLRIGCVVEMIHRGCAESNGQPARARVRKLLGVEAGDQSKSPAGRQHLAAFFLRKGAAVAEAVHILRKFVARDRGNQSPDDEIEIFSPPPLEGRRQRVRGHQRWHQVERTPPAEDPKGFQNLDFVRDIQAVPAFDFHGGGAVRGKFGQEFRGLSNQLLFRCPAQHPG